MKSLIPILCTVLLLLAACGDDSPTDPGDGGGSQFQDAPPIPRPASPGGNVPAQSETWTQVSSGTLRNFAPRIVNLPFASGKIEARAVSSCEWQSFSTFGAGTLAALVGTVGELINSCNYTLAMSVELSDIRPDGRQVVLDDGAWAAGLAKSARAGTIIGFPNTYQPGYVRMTVTPAIIPAEAPHVRRDRYWRLRPLAGGVGDFLLLTGPTSGEISTTYTRGVEKTDTESFGRSVTAELSAGIGPVNASVSATLSEEFSSSVSVSESRSETFTQTVYGEEGKTIQFMVWELVEVYSLTDDAGDTYEVEGWSLALDTMTRAGAALALDATTFPAN